MVLGARETDEVYDQRRELPAVVEGLPGPSHRVDTATDWLGRHAERVAPVRWAFVQFPALTYLYCTSCYREND